MKKYQKLVLYSIVGFLIITFYLLATILSNEPAEEIKNRKSMKIVSTVEETSKNEQNLELTQTETKGLLRQVEYTNNERIQKVEEVCRKYNLGLFKTSQNKTIEHPPVPQYSVFYFDREDKISFCPIYKAGSTTWLFNLCLLAGMTEEEIVGSKKQLSDLARRHYPELEPSDAEETYQK